MFIGKIIPITLLIFANATLAFELAHPVSFPHPSASNPPTEQPSVDIRKTADGHLIAVVKNHEGYPNTIFALQTNNQITVSSPILLTNVTIHYMGDYVIFRSATNGNNLVFKLTNSACPIPPTGNIGTFSGHGLIKQQRPSVYNAIVDFSGNTLPPITELVVCDCVPNTTPDGGNCEAGGTGATECSYSESVSGGTVGIGASCSVKCGDGHYACCSEN